MSQVERYAWASLVAWIVILVLLLTRFTAGFVIWRPDLAFANDPASEHLLWTYVSLAVMAAVAEGVIAGALALRAGRAAIEKDERDLAIEARSNLAAYWFVAVALNVLVVHVLAFGGRAVPLLDLTSIAGVVFALLVVLVLAEIVKRFAVIWNYRAA